MTQPASGALRDLRPGEDPYVDREIRSPRTVSPGLPGNAIAAITIPVGSHPASAITVWVNRERRLNWRRTTSHALTRAEAFRLAEAIADLASLPEVHP